MKIERKETQRTYTFKQLAIGQTFINSDNCLYIKMCDDYESDNAFNFNINKKQFFYGTEEVELIECKIVEI